MHQLNDKDHREETFTNYRYFNLGVPKNEALIAHNKTQSCSTCHMPAAAFADLRKNDIDKIVSQGDDPTKFGNRNTPTAIYAKYSPDFHFDEKIKDYVGGQFWDGRAKHLAEQAGGAATQSC